MIHKTVIILFFVSCVEIGYALQQNCSFYWHNTIEWILINTLWTPLNALSILDKMFFIFFMRGATTYYQLKTINM